MESSSKGDTLGGQRGPGGTPGKKGGKGKRISVGAEGTLGRRSYRGLGEKGPCEEQEGLEQGTPYFFAYFDFVSRAS